METKYAVHVMTVACTMFIAGRWELLDNATQAAENLSKLDGVKYVLLTRYSDNRTIGRFVNGKIVGV